MVMIFPPGLSLAGNGPMVEKNIGELDRINKQAVGQIPDLPENGAVDLKANVKMEGDKANVKILEKSVHTGPDITGKTVEQQESGEQKNVSAPVSEEKIEYRSGNALSPDGGNERNHDR